MRYSTTTTAITALLALTACSTEQAATDTASSATPQSACGLTLEQNTADLQSLDNYIGTIEDGDEGYTFTIGQFSCEGGAIATTLFVSEDQSGEVETIDTIKAISVTGSGFQIVEGLSIGDTLADIRSALPGGELHCGWAHGYYISYAMENFSIQFDTSAHESVLMAQSCEPIPGTVQSTGFQMFRYE